MPPVYGVADIDARDFYEGPSIALLRRGCDFLDMSRQSKPASGDQLAISGKPRANLSRKEPVEGDNSFGKRVQAQLDALGISKAELARRVGVKRWATIHDWITGRQIPKAVNLLRLAEALGMDPIVLLDELLPEPTASGWLDFKRRNQGQLDVDDMIDMRVLARRRPYLTAQSLEAALSVLRVGAPALPR
jgi:transcriptional regulator with XRE-family HTH domain